jgi:hypothetical protein
MKQCSILYERKRKNPPKKYYLLSTSQQEVSADIIQNSAVGNFSPKTEGTKTKVCHQKAKFIS